MKPSRPYEEACEAAALYAVGDLSGAEARRFEQRLQSGCPFCLAELESSQLTVENLLLAAPLVEPPPSLENRLMQHIGAKPAGSDANSAPAPKFVRADEGKWRQIAPGVHIRSLHNDKTMLVRMDAGSRLPQHDHAFEEQCLVLSGEIRDTEGNRAGAGDFIVMPKGSTHPPIFTETGAEFLIAYT
jgi:quercetin dioxygenase-like cupin family protein